MSGSVDFSEEVFQGVQTREHRAEGKRRHDGDDEDHAQSGDRA